MKAKVEAKGEGRKREDLKAACVREAFAIIGEQGLEELSLREVARRLGVSHQAPYRHFANRDALLAEVVRVAFADFAEYLDSRPAGRDAAEDMGNMGRAYLAYALERPLHYRLMFESELPDPAAHPEMMKQAKHAFRLLHRAIEKLPGKDANSAAEVDALFVWATMHGLAGILRGHTLRTLKLKKESRQNLEGEMLRRIGLAMGLEEESCDA